MKWLDTTDVSIAVPTAKPNRHTCTSLTGLDPEHILTYSHRILFAEQQLYDLARYRRIDRNINLSQYKHELR